MGCDTRSFYSVLGLWELKGFFRDIVGLPLPGWMFGLKEWTEVYPCVTSPVIFVCEFWKHLVLRVENGVSLTLANLTKFFPMQLTNTALFATPDVIQIAHDLQGGQSLSRAFRSLWMSTTVKSWICEFTNPCVVAPIFHGQVPEFYYNRKALYTTITTRRVDKTQERQSLTSDIDRARLSWELCLLFCPKLLESTEQLHREVCSSPCTHSCTSTPKYSPHIT